MSEMRRISTLAGRPERRGRRAGLRVRDDDTALQVAEGQRSPARERVVGGDGREPALAADLDRVEPRVDGDAENGDVDDTFGETRRPGVDVDEFEPCAGMLGRPALADAVGVRTECGPRVADAQRAALGTHDGAQRIHFGEHATGVDHHSVSCRRRDDSARSAPEQARAEFRLECGDRT